MLFKSFYFSFILYLVISLFACKNKPSIPQFNINVEVNDLNFGNYTPGKYSYNNHEIFTKEINNPFKIKYRGNASSHAPKKNFSLKFSTKISLDNSSSHKKWKLNAEYIDKTFMRNKLSYDLFRSFSKGNISPKITYLTVNINGNYNGLYTLLKRVDSDYLKLNKNDTNAIIFKQPPISYSTEKHANKHKRLISYSNKAIFYKEFSAKAKNKLIKEAYYNQRYPNIYKSDKTYIIHELTDFIFNSKDIDFKTKPLWTESP